jgi:hypothetical protein
MVKVNERQMRRRRNGPASMMDTKLSTPPQPTITTGGFASASDALLDSEEIISSDLLAHELFRCNLEREEEGWGGVCTNRGCARGYGAVDFVGKVGATLSSTVEQKL